MATLASVESPLCAATNEASWLRLSWLSDDGLPNNTVTGIGQTPDGFLWLSAGNGLARFDGIRFEEFPSTNFIKPPDRGILAMSVTRAGGLRLATDRASVVMLDQDKQRVFTVDDGLPNASVNALFEDREGGLWLAYRGGQVWRIKDGRPRQFTEANGLPGGNLICSLAEDERGRIWFLKNGQLGIFDGDQLKTLTKVDAVASRLTPARGGGVWFCTGFRLHRFAEGGTVQSFGEFTPGRPGTEVSAMVEGKDGSVWIGTTFSGLYRFDGQGFERVPTTHQEILSVFEDAEGNIWVGTGGGGLNQIRPQAVKLHVGESGLPFEAVSSLTEDTNGIIWAATQDGSLSRFIDGRWRTMPVDTNWHGDAMSVCAATNGDIWVGTRYHRLRLWRDNQFISWGDTAQLKGQTVHTLVAGRNGDVWIGGGDDPAKAMRLRDGKIQHYELPPDVRIIRASVEDAAGNIWFGTSKGVLLRVEGDRLVDETGRTTGVPEPIRCLYATPDGEVWIGYAGAGVGVLRRGKFTLISAKHGLHNDFVSQIIADGRGWMWFAGDRGIFRVRRNELEALADGSATRIRSIHYGQGDGLPSLQANFGNSPIALRTRGGNVMLAMRRGLVVVHPEKMRENSPSPPVLITRMVVGERAVAAYGGVLSLPSHDGSVRDLSAKLDGLMLPPDHRRVEFGFTALSFIGSESIAFRYRLDGIDENWVDAEKRSAVYPRLPAGHYEFRVSACNVEGVWNEQAATVGFVVSPFVWETWWFRSGVLLAFTGIIIATVRYVSFRRLRLQLLQLEQQAALHKERARIAKDIHDDLGANLTQISFIGELAHQDRDAPQKVAEHIEKISGTARLAVKSLDEIVWAVNPRNDTLAHFIDYTGQFALDYLRLAGVRCRLDLPELVPARELSTDIRHNLFLVVKEAINNTVKHAHATELRLRIAVNPERLEISVEDNGRGFDQSVTAADGADGLPNMRQRMADIGGRCWIQGRPGAGTKVSLEIQLEREHH